MLKCTHEADASLDPPLHGDCGVHLLLPPVKGRSLSHLTNDMKYPRASDWQRRNLELEQALWANNLMMGALIATWVFIAISMFNLAR